jgi:hypothetical protein
MACMFGFARHIGIDYSGAETRTQGLKGLRVYVAEGRAPSMKVLPLLSPGNYSTRKGVAGLPGVWIPHSCNEEATGGFR